MEKLGFILLTITSRARGIKNFGLEDMCMWVIKSTLKALAGKIRVKPDDNEKYRSCARRAYSDCSMLGEHRMPGFPTCRLCENK